MSGCYIVSIILRALSSLQLVLTFTLFNLVVLFTTASLALHHLVNHDYPGMKVLVTIYFAGNLRHVNVFVLHSTLTLFTVKNNSVAFDINELSCVTWVRSDLIDSRRL